MRRKDWIIFLDSGDTLVDEGSEVRLPGEEIVQRAELIPGAKETLLYLKKEGYRMALVADGLTESFNRVYAQHGLADIFEVRSISEERGCHKPACEMFQYALDEMHLTEEDKPRIMMVGNNLERDIVGANRFGIISVLETWSPRYRMEPQCEEEVPDYRIGRIDRLMELFEI